MKTFNGNNITKIAIRSTIRRGSLTEVCKLYHDIYGDAVEPEKVRAFMKEFVSARHAAVIGSRFGLGERRRSAWEMFSIRKNGRYEGNDLKQAVDAVKEYIADPCNPYAKKPMMGFTHLYFCSPAYGHQDDNKWRSIEIKGNEKFCETICKLAEKYSK